MGMPRCSSILGASAGTTGEVPNLTSRTAGSSGGAEYIGMQDSSGRMNLSCGQRVRVEMSPEQEGSGGERLG